MTNPNNAIGTNAGYNGRTTPNALNDDLGALSRGVLSGWACSPKSGMTVQIGGNGTARDVAIAEDNAGNKTTINNRSGQPVDVTIPASPSTGNRIDYIIAYVANPQAGTGASDVDFPSQCGIIVVSGTVANSPSGPSSATIRSAITADGADGSTAYYVRLAYVYVGQSVSTIGSGAIYQGTKASLTAGLSSSSVSTSQIADYAVTTGKIANSAVNSAKINWASLAPNSWTTLNSTYGVTYAKYGAFVFLNVYFRNVALTGNPQSFGTLPSGYRPPTDVAARNAYDNMQGLVVVDTTGAVNIQYTGAAPSYCFVSLCFPAA